MKRWSRGGSQASHDRWLVSYADFITLLFAFFVVLYASAEMDKKKVVQLSSAIQGAFQHLGAMPQASPALTNTPSQPGTKPGGSVDAYALQRELESVLGNELRQHEIEMRVTPEGLVLSLHEVGFFNSGQAKMLPTALPKLARIAHILNEHGFDIRVEGHTDNVPIHTAEFQSNWELSTARATQVVTLLVENYELDPLTVAAAGYGPYRPVASNDTAEGRKLNRRVDLVITSRNAARSAGPATTPAKVDAEEENSQPSSGGLVP